MEFDLCDRCLGTSGASRLGVSGINGGQRVGWGW